MSRSRNRVFLEADTLLMNLTQELDGNMQAVKGNVGRGDAERRAN